MKGIAVAKKVDRFVLDCSVALAWCFHDEQDPYADAIAGRFPAIDVVVPSLWHLEIANVFVVGERRGRSTQADTLTWTGFLSSLPVTVDGETVARAWADTLSLARAHNLTAYDAAYLELALRLGLPLATLDSQLKSAAQAAGVPLYQP
jgi:predicted nucleic acid-binding protein